MTFARWLSHQNGRNDTVGDLARLLAHDLAIVSIGALYPSLAAHVKRYAIDAPGSLTVQGMLRRAWGEWVQSLRRAERRTPPEDGPPGASTTGMSRTGLTQHLHAPTRGVNNISVRGVKSCNSSATLRTHPGATMKLAKLFAVLRALIPVVQKAVELIQEAKASDSEKGKKITRQEAAHIALELGPALVEAVCDQLGIHVED